MARSSVSSFQIRKITAGSLQELSDDLAVEEPLEIRLIYGPAERREIKSISVTMRTPGQDFELALGFLFTEGIITGMDQVEDIFNNPEDCSNRQENIVTVALQSDQVTDLKKLERHFYTSSSCGVCGKASIEAIRTLKEQDETLKDNLSVPVSILHLLPQILNTQQDIFRSTGGLHASALFDMTGNILVTREDVGRHNALDKLVGASLQKGLLPLDSHILLLSGRASFELIQKAAMAGIKIVTAVGAPSSLAVQLAMEFNITLIGFLRNERMNIYSGMQRIII
jgi:FdhD protein